MQGSSVFISVPSPDVRTVHVPQWPRSAAGLPGCILQAGPGPAAHGQHRWPGSAQGRGHQKLGGVDKGWKVRPKLDPSWEHIVARVNVYAAMRKLRSIPAWSYLQHRSKVSAFALRVFEADACIRFVCGHEYQHRSASDVL